MSIVLDGSNGVTFPNGGNPQAEQSAKDAKASALAKLTALGLTQAEVTALIG